MSHTEKQDQTRGASIDESIAHWLKLAEEADAWAAYEEKQVGSGATHRAKAETYRATAKALGLEKETGKPHCSCCLKPRR